MRKGGKRWGVGLTVRLNHQLLGLPAGFEGQDVNGPESLDPALSGLSGFWESFIATRSWPEVKVKGKVFWGRSSSVDWPLTSAGVARRPGSADGQKRTDRPRATVQGLFFVSWLVWYILASASYKGGATAMAFGQVQGA